MNRTITAYFDSRSDAQNAADRLTESGITRDSINIHDAGSDTAATSTSSEQKGFWESLGDLFMPDEDRYTYSEGIRRGGSVLSVSADSAEFDRVSDILEGAGAVDLDTRESEWRSEGWTGYDSSRTGDYAGQTGYTGAGAAGTAGGLGAADRDATGSGYTGAYRASDDYASGDGRESEGYIPVAEEQLRVGKREVDHGRVRIRSYVRETPVEEHVRLRDETIDIERNPVDRAATSADNLFEERVIEAEERDEEAVIAKEARVVEEVRLRKEAEEREETIRDTVRHTEVEVEDERVGDTDRIRRDRDI